MKLICCGNRQLDSYGKHSEREGDGAMGSDYVVTCPDCGTKYYVQERVF